MYRFAQRTMMLAAGTAASSIIAGAILGLAGGLGGRMDLLGEAYAQDRAGEGSSPGEALLISKENFKQLLSAVVQRLTGRELSIRDIDIDLGWQTRFSAHDIAFANAEWAETPHMLTASALRATVDVGALLNGQIVAPSIELDQPRVILAVSTQGEMNLPDMGTQEEKAAAFNLSSLPVVRHLLVRDGTVVYRDYRTDTRLQAQIARLSLEAPENEPITISGQGTYDGAPFQLTANAGSWERLRSDDGAPVPLELQSSLGPLRMQASGAVQTPLKLSALKLHVTGDDMPDVYPLAQTLAEKTPSYDISAQVSSRAKGNGQQFRLSELQARLGESTLTGRLVAELGTGTPEISGELSSKLIRVDDLTGFLPWDQAASPQPASEQRVLPTEPLNLQALRQVEADFEIAVDRLQTATATVEDLQADITLQDGILRLQPAQLAVGGGQMTAWLSLYADADPRQADVIVRARQVQVGQFVGDLPLASVPTKGVASANVNLSMAGNSVAALAGSADGSIVLMMSEGQVSGMLIELLGLDITEALGLVVTEADNDAPVPIRCAVGEIDAQQGVLNLGTFVIDTRDTRIDVKGRVNLQQETLDLRIKPYPKDFSLLSLRVPIGIQGTLANPEVFTDPVGLGVEATLDKVLNALLTPIVGLIPPMDLGLADNAGCQQLLQEARAASQG